MTTRPSTKRSGWKLAFNVHKHKARRLHYDFRLELDGALKSWMLPKGPSLDPTSRRLAVEVEDHPMDYADFEGVIAEGYDAGTVMLWDRGTWIPEGDPHVGYHNGKLEFTLHGEKLKGKFVLIRTKGSNWLLIKRRDKSARSAEQGEIVDEAPSSVLTNRSLEQIAIDRDRIWSGCAAG